MKDTLQLIVAILIGIAALVIVFLLFTFFINGSLWLIQNVYPWLVILAWIVFVIDVFIAVPLLIFRKSRNLSGIMFFISSYVYGFTLWLYGFALSYIIWRVWALIVGLVIIGIGVVPVALLQAL